MVIADSPFKSAYNLIYDVAKKQKKSLPTGIFKIFYFLLKEKINRKVKFNLDKCDVETALKKAKH